MRTTKELITFKIFATVLVLSVEWIHEKFYKAAAESKEMVKAKLDS